MNFVGKILLHTIYCKKNAKFVKQDVFINRQQIGGKKRTHLALHRRILFLCDLLLIKIFR
jgi:hypothetical protein